MNPIRRYRNGVVSYERWEEDGKRHRVDGPAVIRFYSWGRRELWYFKGKRHRLDGPAEIYYSSNVDIENWYSRGKLHRSDGPAETRFYEDGQIAGHQWFSHGNVHRSEGPAVICYDSAGLVSQEDWLIQGEIQRLDGPAMISYKDGRVYYQFWCWHDDFHRLGGPAYQRFASNGELVDQKYYLYGIELSYLAFVLALESEGLNRLLGLARIARTPSLIRAIKEIDPALARNMEAAEAFK